MSQDGHSVAVLSGDLTVEQRLAVLDRFRAGLEKVLVTMNVLPRGLDLGEVDMIINFDLKGWDHCRTFCHRIDRTAQWGKKTIAIILVDDKQGMKDCRLIEAHFQQSIPLLDTDNLDEIQIISL